MNGIVSLCVWFSDYGSVRVCRQRGFICLKYAEIFVFEFDVLCVCSCGHCVSVDRVDFCLAFSWVCRVCTAIVGWDGR